MTSSVSTTPPCEIIYNKQKLGQLVQLAFEGHTTHCGRLGIGFDEHAARSGRATEGNGPQTRRRRSPQINLASFPRCDGALRKEKISKGCERGGSVEPLTWKTVKPAVGPPPVDATSSGGASSSTRPTTMLRMAPYESSTSQFVSESDRPLSADGVSAAGATLGKSLEP